MRRLICLVLSLVVPTAAARAEGAVAWGVTANITDGFAFGESHGYATKAEAEQKALEGCRNFKAAPGPAANCRIVASYLNECVATAFDPDPRSAGFAYGIGPSKEGAKERALENCRKAAGPQRASFCAFSKVFCDGAAANR